MKTDYNDFIGIYHDVYPEGYCEHLIEEFESLTKKGVGSNRQTGEGVQKHKKDDFQIVLNYKISRHTLFNKMDSSDVFFEGLQKCYDQYSEQFSILRDMSLTSTHMKMQRTDPGGGYHVWHAEQMNLEQSSRVLVYMLYLNTLEDESAGETEFLYQQRRIKPTKNTMVLWPASYTHAHRGNVVHGEQSKYIVTGWFYLNE